MRREVLSFTPHHLQGIQVKGHHRDRRTHQTWRRVGLSEVGSCFQISEGRGGGKRRKELRFQTCLRGPRGKPGAAGVEAPGAGLGLKVGAAGRCKGLSGLAPLGLRGEGRARARLPAGVEGTGISGGTDLGALEGPLGPGLLNAKGSKEVCALLPPGCGLAQAPPSASVLL